jgi:hypothetical protein
MDRFMGPLDACVSLPAPPPGGGWNRAGPAFVSWTSPRGRGDVSRLPPGRDARLAWLARRAPILSLPMLRRAQAKAGGKSMHLVAADAQSLGLP